MLTSHLAIKNSDLSERDRQLSESQSEIVVLKSKLAEHELERKKLHNTIQVFQISLFMPYQLQNY